jgi:adenosylhomocysteine nucleosidase
MNNSRVIVIVSANSEWQAIKSILSPDVISSSQVGEFFEIPPLTYFHGGWGKISSAATTQYIIDLYQPDLLVNLGTCGGFKGRISSGTIILVTKTIVYDIFEQMSGSDEAIAHYSTDIDLSWLNDQVQINIQNSDAPIVRGLLISADRDIVCGEIPELVMKYGAIAADWESGAIAWVANRNQVRCLILRGVTDLVGEEGGEAYGNMALFHEKTQVVMKQLIQQLPIFL